MFLNYEVNVTFNWEEKITTSLERILRVGRKIGIYNVYIFRACTFRYQKTREFNPKHPVYRIFRLQMFNLPYGTYSGYTIYERTLKKMWEKMR